MRNAQDRRGRDGGDAFRRFLPLVVMIAGRVANKQKGAESVAAPFAAAPIELPLGARVETMAVGSERLILNLLLADGERSS